MTWSQLGLAAADFAFTLIQRWAIERERQAELKAAWSKARGQAAGEAARAASAATQEAMNARR